MKQPNLSNSDQLREAMRAWVSGITIVTANYAGEQHGMTVSSFTSIAIEPPMIIVALQTGTRTHKLVTKSKFFAATILASSQQEISDRFAGRIADSEDRLAGIETETLVSKAPFIKGGLAYFDCRVTQATPVGDNTLFLAEVIAAQSNYPGQPLIYYNTNYQNLVE